MFKLGLFTQAFFDFERMVELYPEESTTHYNYALTCLQLDELGEAILALDFGIINRGCCESDTDREILEVDVDDSIAALFSEVKRMLTRRAHSHLKVTPIQLRGHTPHPAPLSPRSHAIAASLRPAGSAVLHLPATVHRPRLVRHAI